MSPLQGPDGITAGVDDNVYGLICAGGDSEEAVQHLAHHADAFLRSIWITSCDASDIRMESTQIERYVSTGLHCMSLDPRTRQAIHDLNMQGWPLMRWV